MHKDEAGSADFELERILRQELADLLASPYFVRSPVQCRLLRYLVDHRLRGDLPAPKAYAIATQALGRPADFDPSIDSYPRVMVGRLRSLLERYYGERPWLYRLRIPQGSYEVVVQYRSGPPSRSSGAGAGAVAGGGVGAAAGPDGLAAASIGAGGGGGEPRPRVKKPVGFQPARLEGGGVHPGLAAGYDSLAALLAPVEEPEAPPITLWDRFCAWLDRVLPQPDKLRRWLAFVLAVSLAALLGGGAALLASWYGDRGEGGGIFSSTSAAGSSAYVPMPRLDVQVKAAQADNPDAQAMAAAVAARLRDAGRRFEMLSLMGGEDGSAHTQAQAQALKPDYRMELLLTPAEAGQMDAAVIVYRMADRSSIWSRRFRIGANEGPDYPSLEPAIVQVAGNYGVIVRDQAVKFAKDYRSGFPCLAQFQRMRVAQQLEDAHKVAACVADAAAANPRDPVTLAAHSYMLHQAATREPDANKAKALTSQGLGLASAAYAAEPTSAHAAFAQARAYFTIGRCPVALGMARRAEEGNRLDADMLSRLSVMYQICGDNQQADRLSSRALQLDPSFPTVPLMARASILLMQDQPQKALDELAGLANIQPITAHYHVIQALALARLGRRDEAQEHWKRLIALAGMPENARAEDVLRHFAVMDTMVRREAALLRDAGVVPLRTAN